MATTPIGSATSTPPTQAALGQEDFLRILTTQLSFQDPLKPLDNQQFIAQMAQFAALEQTRLMNDNLEVMLGLQAAMQSVGLLGRTVEVVTESGTAAGQVTSLRFSDGVPLVTVKTAADRFLTDLSLSRVVTVR